MNRIDRRALFTSGAAAALLTATGVSLEAAPRMGGRLRIAVPRGDGSLDRIARGALFDTLTELTPDGVLCGSLATAWDGSTDARTWRFDLRGDVRFHDGAPLTADEVAASLLADGQAGARGIVGIGADADRRLEITLARGNPHLPFLLAEPAFHVARARQGGKDLASAVGTGLYRVRCADRDRHFIADRTDGHFREGQAGWAASVEIVAIPDAGVRAEALRDGFVDVAVLPLPEGLRDRGEFVYLPSADDMTIATHRGVGMPRTAGAQDRFEDSRIAERWWLV